ncbi:MAG: hypothetical protein L3K03_03675 [Thermoplasmata archaeon]|nr:hypothetical protein [Thermoplasmata archaeon]
MIKSRALSEAEGLLTQRVLAGEGSGPRSPGSGTEVPRRTRQTVVQRIYQRGWVHDRYVPNPAWIDRPFVTFALAQPYSEEVVRAAQRWRQEAGTVLLWVSPETLFGVFFSRDERSRSRLAEKLRSSVRDRTEILLALDLREQAIPVYFDFEAAWSRVAGLSGAISYPHSLPGVVVDPARSEGEPSGGRNLRPLSELVGTSFPSGRFRSPRLGSSLHIRGNVEQRYLRHGWMERRTFLEPTEVARWVSDFPRRVAFVQGEMLPGATAPALFHALVEECRINPFLYATDHQRVLLATFSQDPGTRRSEREIPRAGVLATLQKSLRGITIVRDSLDSMSTLVDHRYDHLFDTDDAGR